MEDRTRKRMIWTIQIQVLVLILSPIHSPSVWADGNIPREELPISWKEEADLTDVFFLNEQLGWAVGCHGVILQTRDGGRNWHQTANAQNVVANPMSLDQKIRSLRSGVRTSWTGVADGNANRSTKLRCRFDSVFFIDELNGWVAGGYDVPYVDRSRGVILRTSDGGSSWRPVDGLVIPRIKKIQFSSRTGGWALGSTGNLFRTGLFFTNDAGETWSSQAAGNMPDWQTGVEVNGKFVNIDSAGNLGVVQQGRFESSVVLGGPTGRFSSLSMLDAQRGWAVGQAGQIYQTSNGGLSWSNAISPSEQKRLKHFDFSTCCLSKNKLWIAGNPGSIVLSIDLQDGSLNLHTTGLPLPINKIQFVSDQRGWAVGSLGTVLGTSDGGTTWQRQRGRQTGVAMLAFDHDGNPPLELFATYAGEENRICGLATIQDHSGAALWQSVERLGCATAIHFSLPENRELKIAELVKTIRTLRPRTIVCNDRFLKDQGSFDDFESLLVDAIRLAAERDVFENHSVIASLSPWQVDRLAVLDATGSLKVDSQRMLPRTGSRVEDRVALSRALLGKTLMSSTKPVYRVRNFTTTSKQQSDLFSGLSGFGQPIPSRASGTGFRGNLNSIQLANSKDERLAAFQKIPVNNAAQFMVWRQQVLAWALGFKQDLAGVWLMQLAENYLSSGETELAAATLEILANRIPDHALSPAALTWVVQHFASDEMSQLAYNQMDASNGINGTSIDGDYQSPTRTLTMQVNGVSHMIWRPVEKPIKAGSKTGSSSDGSFVNGPDPERVDSKAFFKNRQERAHQLLGKLGVRDPDLVSGPEYRLLDSLLKRKLKGTSQTVSLLKGLVQQGESLPRGISVAAERELILEGIIPATQEPIGLFPFYAETPPKLNGELSDSIWTKAMQNNRGVRHYEVESSLTNEPDRIIFARDENFLYVGMRCQKLRDHAYPTTQQPRPRDPDLSRRDRVELRFDVDRDYRTYGQFTVDHRGWCAESCGGSTGWNPRWFVDHDENEQEWSIEMAIPLEELIPGPIPTDAVWGLRMVRLDQQGQDLWSGQSSSAESTGLQVGFLSQPIQYELIQFK